MNHNPYAPPKANVDGLTGVEAAAPAPSARLYSSMQMAVASFIGTPIAASWFAAANFRAFEQRRAARQILLWGLAATTLVLGIAFVLPEGTPNAVLPVAYSVGVRLIADRVFAACLKDHESRGGRRGSWWRVVGVSFLFALGVLAVVWGVGFALFELGMVTL